MRHVWIFSFAILFLCSCGNWDSEIVRNRSNFPKLRVGMTKTEVKKIMGEPIQGNKYCAPNIWFYYTTCKWSDGMITRDECSPVVFKGDIVAGIGKEYYQKNCLLAPFDNEDM